MVINIHIKTNGMIRSENPYTGELLQEYSELTLDEIEKKVQQAHIAFKEWKNTSFQTRAALLKKSAAILRKNKDELAALITHEMGKVIRESESEVQKSAWVCEYYAEHGEEFLSDQNLEVSSGRSKLVYDPLGPILGIMPWNFPFYQVFRFAPPTLMAGNVAMLKHASNVPGCALAIEEIFKEAGFPDGVFTTLLVRADAAGDLIADNRIQGVSLTGSVQAGMKVAGIAGRNIKKSVLELGGSDPFIVLKDANIAKAAEIAANARMINCGQSCIAAKRFIVEDAVAHEFLEKFSGYLEKKNFGDPMDIHTDYASMASKDLKRDLDKQVSDSVSAGARIYWKSNQLEHVNAFYNPTVLVDVRPGMPAYEEELFGPAATVFVVRDSNDAVDLANDSPFGLGASIWSEDVEKAEHLAREIESGIIYINELVASRPEIPFGGVKKSGFGRELSFLGIREFVNRKTIWMP